MDHFISPWLQCDFLDEKSSRFLAGHSQVRSYPASTDFVLPGESSPFWCFVLSGLVAGIKASPQGREIYVWLAGRGDYFTGTKHLFTHRPPNHNIRFLRNTDLLLTPLPAMRHAQQHFLKASELLHVLKQRRMQHQEELLQLLMLDTHTRYARFRKTMRSLFALLGEKEQIAYLRMSRSQYYAAKAHWDNDQG